MSKIKIFQVDAFTDRLFSGNPAAICLLDDWMDDEQMQSIGAENNLAETAFVVSKENHFEIRWFTPTVEVDLCGHATLATAYVLFHCMGYQGSEIIFNSTRSGELKAMQQKDLIFLDFPVDNLSISDFAEEIQGCIGIRPREVYKGKTDYIAVVDSESDVRNLCPDIPAISKLDARGLIVTAKGDEADFVSRFFGPQSGVDEDPVTGSAHTSLIPLWTKKLLKTEMTALQLSKRGGTLICMNKGSRCLIGGKAKLYMTGEINIS